MYLTLTLNSFNLTVSFSSSGLITCAPNDTAEAMTFTTIDVPSDEVVCFTLEDLFSNDTSTSYIPRNIPSYSPNENFTWGISNANAYSADKVYTRIWYHQQDSDSPSPGDDAERLFSVYNERDCEHDSSEPQLTFPISSGGGDCYETLHPIKSFAVGSAKRINRHHKCLTAWTGSAPGRGIAAAIGVATALLVGGILGW
ncbi:hypothetical protein E4T50_08166 [Aureobasidium sp. EXF-12298]|nr:hypothetical protein E4T50_08166 [Aureobasidium sp. EXF-12298]